MLQGGQHLLKFVDFFGVSFIAFLLGISQMITFGWIYGVNRIALDIEFMLGVKTGWYWRICWAVITPALMTAIFVYNLVMFEPVNYKGHEYPHYAYSELRDLIYMKTMTLKIQFDSNRMGDICCRYYAVTLLGAVCRVQTKREHFD